MEKEAEFPAPLDPPIVDVSVTSDETTEAPQVATVVAKTRLPVIFYRLMPNPSLKAVQQYIASFEYSLHPQSNFNSQKQRPLFLIMDTARMKYNLDLVCSSGFEYVISKLHCNPSNVRRLYLFVALFLTAGLPDVERYPSSFQTVLDDQVDKELPTIMP